MLEDGAFNGVELWYITIKNTKFYWKLSKGFYVVKLLLYKIPP